MFASGLPSWSRRPLTTRFTSRAHRRRRNPLAYSHDWQLEDRCLLSGPDPLMPLATVDEPGDVLYYDQSVPLKTITLTNNTDQTVFPFIRDANSRVFMEGDTRGQYDPFDPINQEYRGYVGYVQGTTNYLGLPAGQTITINVPLVFWDGARINIGTDATYLTPLHGSEINPYQFFFINSDGSETARAIVPSRDNADPTKFSSTGLIMWYHSTDNLGPTTDSPDQLIEMTFRDPYLGQFPNIPPSEQITLINYDVSYVDSILLPVAMEADNVPIPNVGVAHPYGWIGSDHDFADMQQALDTFTRDNNSLLGEYFDGHGYPKFYNPDEVVDGIKVPAGANIIGESPLNDVRSSFDQNRYRLTSGGEGIIQLSNPGHPNHNTIQFDDNIPVSFFQQLQAGLASGWNVTSPDDQQLPAGTKVVAVDADQRLVTLNQDTTGDGTQVFSYVFKRPVRDYVAERLLDLWYSWAHYYVDLHHSHQPPAPATGHTVALSNVLTFDNPVEGLVVGMQVTGPGIPADTRCTITGIAEDQTSATLSLLTSAAAGTYTFDKVLPIKGHGEAHPFELEFPDQDQDAARLFAQGVYQVMSAMSTIPKEGKALQILFNSIGGNVGKLPHASTATHQEVVGALRDVIKSILRGVYDFRLFDESQWYPDPKTPTGGANFNVWNLDPFVWFVHVELGLSGYGFSLDDDVADIGAGGATQLLVSIGGVNGLPNTYEWTWGAPYGRVDAIGKVDLSNPARIFGFAPTDFWRVNPADPNVGPGALVRGPGVPEGTRVLARDENNNTFVLDKPLDTSHLDPDEFYRFTFYGHEQDLTRGLFAKIIRSDRRDRMHFAAVECSCVAGTFDREHRLHLLGW